MDLTFQLPMQYCSLNHWTLLSPPDISTTGQCCHFGLAFSFLLELFLYSSPVAYWASTDLGSSFSSVISLLFLTVHGVLKARILKWFAISFSSGPHSVRRRSDISVILINFWNKSELENNTHSSLLVLGIEINM